MRLLTRLIPALAAGSLVGAASLAAQAQEHGPGTFRWYVGGHGGVLIFETPAQTRGGMPMAGGHLLVTAKRTALLVSVEEGFGSNEVTAYNDPTGPGGMRTVGFNDLRKYSATLIAYPLRSAAQPFFGVGFGIWQVHHPFPVGVFASSADRTAAEERAKELGSSGFASFLGGVEFRVSGFTAFGMYQVTTSPAAGRLLVGPTHAFSGGIRFSLGGAREGVSGGGY